MFVAAFKEMLGSLPPRDAGYNATVQRLSEEDCFSNPAAEFFTRLTNYASSRSPAPGATHYDPRLLLTALCMTRFPIQTLGIPEEPLRFTLLNSAWKFIRLIDVILYIHNRAEDDAADNFLGGDICTEYMLALNEYHAAWHALVDAAPCSSVGY